MPAPRIESTGGEDTQQVADAAADLSDLRRALATLRTLAGTAARSGRCLAESITAGTRRGYRALCFELICEADCKYPRVTIPPDGQTIFARFFSSRTLARRTLQSLYILVTPCQPRLAIVPGVSPFSAEGEDLY